LWLFCATVAAAADQLSWKDLRANVDRWIEGPVSLIATADEKKVWKRLKSPEEKMQFIKIFWARRDPILRTRANEFKQEFYKRIEYANQNFAEKTTPGWNTARGQVYLVFGPPSREDKQSIEGSSRPGLLWVYDKPPSDQIPRNEALLFVYRDFKYVLAPPQPDAGDVFAERERAIEAGFRYQTIPAMVQRAFADVTTRRIIDERKNYDSLLFSVETTEKFGIAGIDFDIRRPTGGNVQVIIPVEDVPVYDEADRKFAELYFKQELRKGDSVVATNEHTAAFNWTANNYEDLKELAVPLPPLNAPAGEYQLVVTVQDRISNIAETKTFPARF
jgi:GWxTD domain-containing protein